MPLSCTPTASFKVCINCGHQARRTIRHCARCTPTGTVHAASTWREPTVAEVSARADRTARLGALLDLFDAEAAA